MAAALVSVASSVGAQTEIDFEWSAPPECPGSEDVRERVDSALEGTNASGSGIEARGTVTRTASHRFRAELEIIGPALQVKRTLEAATCASVSEASALLIALAINPDAAISDTPQAETIEAPKPPAEPKPSPALPPRSNERPEREEAEPKSPERRFRAGFAVASDYGTLPEVTIGPELFASYGGQLRLELGAGLFLPRSGTLPESERAGADFFLATLALRACYELIATKASLSACTAVSGDLIHVEGFGPIVTTSADLFSATIGGGLLGSIALSRTVRLRLAVLAAAPFSRPDYAILGAGVVHQSSSIVARAALGGEVEFE